MGLKEVLVGAARAGDSDGVGGGGRPGPVQGAVRRIAEELGIHPEALRTRVRQAEIDRGDRPGTTTDEARRIREPEKEVREPGAGQRAPAERVGLSIAAELDRPSR